MVEVNRKLVEIHKKQPKKAFKIIFDKVEARVT